MDDRKTLLERAQELAADGFNFSKHWPTKKLITEIIRFESEHYPDGPPETNQITTTQAETTNRMAVYRKRPPCPTCQSFPVVCMMRRPGYEKYRCRVCGARWEVK